MNLQPHIKRTLLQAVMIAAGLTITVAANAQAFVAFEGRLLVASADMDNVHMTVTDGTETMDVALRPNGKFEFFIPVNDQVTLTLDRPGYISKTMLIDTHNAPSKEGVIDRTARVELDLALEPQPSDLELCYDKPMGKVEFDATTGETRIIDLDPDLLIASENTSSAVPM